jgi:hypothetical protein
MQDFKTGGYCPSCLHSKNECTCLQQQLNRITSASNDAKPNVIRSVCDCGNELTEKELFYETCLKCEKDLSQTDV